MNYKWMLMILVFIIILAALLLLIVIKLSKKNEHIKSLKTERSSKKQFLTRSYYFFNHFFITRNYVHKVRNRVEMLELSDNFTIMRKTMVFSYVAIGSSLILFFMLLLLDTKLYFLIIGTLTIYIIHNQILNALVEKIDDKLLHQFEKFLGDIRHHFHNHGMIDEAVYDSIEDSPYEMSLHAQKMYEVLTSQDSENTIEQYYDLVPNKYFKTFLALCYTVSKFGDKTIDGKSMFLTNLNYLKQEINLETLRRRQVNYLFKSLSMIAILPIFFLSFIENWAKTNLSELAIYYDGAYGFAVQIGLFIIVVIAYELINKMQSNVEEQKLFKNRIENSILKITVVEKMILAVIQKQFSKAMRYSELLKNVGAKTKIECFYLKRFIWGSIGLLISLITFIYGHQLTAKNILNESVDLMTQNNQVDLNAEEDIVEFDRYFVLKYSGREVTYQTLENEVKEKGKINDSKQAGIITTRILDKIKLYEKEYFKWWELLVSLLFGMIFYQVPLYILHFRKTVLQMNMEDEVVQFHTIILMLMYIERMSVEDLLEWMGMFANVFKQSIYKCLNNFEHGDIEALEQLKTDEPFSPFVRIVENLQAATDKISIISAFDELKIERTFYQEKRKQDNDIIVQKKGLWGKMIAFTPMTATIVFYLIVPFVHLSVTQFMNYSNQIKNYL